MSDFHAAVGSVKDRTLIRPDQFTVEEDIDHREGVDDKEKVVGAATYLEGKHNLRLEGEDQDLAGDQAFISMWRLW